jgi:hypothetical protein
MTSCHTRGTQYPNGKRLREVYAREINLTDTQQQHDGGTNRIRTKKNQRTEGAADDTHEMMCVYFIINKPLSLSLFLTVP